MISAFAIWISVMIIFPYYPDNKEIYDSNVFQTVLRNTQLVLEVFGENLNCATDSGSPQLGNSAAKFG